MKHSNGISTVALALALLLLALAGGCNKSASAKGDNAVATKAAGTAVVAENAALGEEGKAAEGGCANCPDCAGKAAEGVAAEDASTTTAGIEQCGGSKVAGEACAECAAKGEGQCAECAAKAAAKAEGECSGDCGENCTDESKDGESTDDTAKDGEEQKEVEESSNA